MAEALLAVHRSYLPQVLPLVKAHRLVAMAHITGGGLTDNLPRVLPGHLDAVIDTASWEVPAPVPVPGGEGRACPWRTPAAPSIWGWAWSWSATRRRLQEVLADLRAAGEAAWVLGELAQGGGRVVYR